MLADLTALVQHLGQPHVLVVGDLMLDRYVWGDAERISQEAPVILLHADRREERLGGLRLVGLGLGYPLAKVLVGFIGEAAFPLIFIFDPQMIALTFLFALLLSAGASLGPALGAARVRISNTIRYG